MKYTLFFAVGVAIAVSGCSGKSSTSSQQATQTAAPASVAGAGAATTEPAGSNANPMTTLPVYPGATKLATQFTKPMSFCSHKMTMTVYHVGDTPEKVSSWYLSRMPGATTAKIASPGAATTGQGTSGYFIVDSGGGSAAIVERMHFGALEKQAQRFGIGNKTTIGLNSYDPPLSSEEVALFKAGSGTDAAAKAQAEVRLKQKCGSNGFSFGG